MKPSIKKLDVVALIDDLSDKNLVAGQVDTVVEVLPQGVFELELCDKGTGQKFAILPLRAKQLLRL